MQVMWNNVWLLEQRCRSPVKVKIYMAGCSSCVQENMKPTARPVPPSTPQQQPSWADVCRHGQTLAGAGSTLQSHPISGEFPSAPSQPGMVVLPGMSRRPAPAGTAAAASEEQRLVSDWEQKGVSGGMHGAGGPSSQEGQEQKRCWGAGIIKVGFRWFFS